MKTFYIYFLIFFVLLKFYTPTYNSIRTLEDDFDDSEFNKDITSSYSEEPEAIVQPRSQTNMTPTKESSTNISTEIKDQSTNTENTKSASEIKNIDSTLNQKSSNSDSTKVVSPDSSTDSSTSISTDPQIPIDNQFVNAYKNRKDYPAKYIAETNIIKSEFDCFAKFIYPYVNKLSGLLQANILYSVKINKDDPKTFGKYCVHPETFKLEYSEGVKRTWKYFSAVLGDKMKKVRKSITCVLTTSKQLKANLDIKPVIKPNSKVSQSISNFLKCAGAYSAMRLRFFLMPIEDMKKMYYTKTLENNKVVTGFKASLDEARSLVKCFVDFTQSQIDYNNSYYNSLKNDVFETLSNSDTCKFNTEDFCWSNPTTIKRQFPKYNDDDWKIIESENRSEPDNKKYKDAIELIAKAKKLYKRIHTLTLANARKIIADCQLQNVPEFKDLTPEDKKKRFLTDDKASSKSSSTSSSTDNDSILDQVLPESLINMQNKCYDMITNKCKDNADFFKDYKEKKGKDARIPSACRSTNLENDLKNTKFIEDCYAYILRNFGEDNGFTLNYAKLENFYITLPSSRRVLPEAVTVETNTYLMNEEEEKTDKTNTQLHKLINPISDDVVVVDGNTPNSLADEDDRKKELEDDADKDLSPLSSGKITLNLVALVFLALLI
jgi:hypothetical protein